MQMPRKKSGISVRLRNPVDTTLRARGVFEVAAIHIDDTVFHFDPALRLKREKVPGYVWLENADLGISAFGKTDNEALEAMGDVFYLQWKSLVESPKSKIHPSACQVRERLVKSVSRITELV